MRKSARWSLSILGVVAALGIALLLGKDPLLKSWTERRLSRETGLPARLGQLKLGLGSASLHLKDLRLYNPPEFGGSVLLDVPELYLQVAPAQAAGGKLRLKLVRLHLRELNVIRNREGRLNLEALSARAEKPARAPASKPAPPAARLPFAGIDQLRLTADRLTYTDEKNPANNRAFNLGVRDETATNLTTEAELETWSKALLLRVLVRQILEQQIHPKKSGLNLLLDALNSR